MNKTKMPAYLLFLLLLASTVSAISAPYCDWDSDEGNSLCTYDGHWWADSSRGSSRGTDFDDVQGDTSTPKYEEQDAYAVAGVDAQITSLGNIDVGFTAGAMDWNGGYCSSWADCNVYDLYLYCDGSTQYHNDPCFGYCSDKSKTDTCTFDDGDIGTYTVKVKAKINTEDEGYNDISETTYSYFYLNIGCATDSYCKNKYGSAYTCEIKSNGGRTVCEKGYVKHDHKGCYGGDVYWYDSNNARNDKYQTCASDEKCSGSSCVVKSCSDLGYSAGSCSSSGSKKRTGDDIYECKDQGGSNTILCWTKTYSKGHGDFCDELTTFSKTCNYDESDCDSNSECASGLVCTGGIATCWGFDCGCCYSGEKWDKNAKKCKKADGASCSSNSQCYGGYCVHNVCRSSSTHCGDNYCDNGESYDNCKADCKPSNGHKDYCDWKGTCSHNEYDCDSDSECGTNLYCKRPPGTGYGDTSPTYDYDGCCYSNENWDISTHTCKKKDGESCSSGSECYGGYCVHNMCRSTNTFCGDNYCDRTLGEDYDRCSWDCDPQLGHADYCDWKGNCAHGEYDCDSDSECASNLVCVGSSWTGDKGCCYSNEEWDTTSHKCKAKNGEPCSQDSNCYSGHCVHNICRPTDPYHGDGYCDSGETCATSQQDCGKCDQAYCITGSECEGGHCVHNKCWHNSYIKGDGYCDTQVGESQANSPNDCYGQLTVLDVTYWPPSVNQGQSFTVKAMLQNKGTIAQTLNLEAGIPPNSWYTYVISTNATQNFTSQAYWGITKCCPGNNYYDAKRITLQPGEQQEVTFHLTAPTIHDVDACDTGNPKKSAWDSSHQLVVGLYSQCGQAYTQYKAKPIHVNDRYCYRDSDCASNERCHFSSGKPDGACAVAICQNECDSEGSYFCVGNELKECKDIDNDGCLESDHIDYCVGDYECRAGNSACYYKPPKTKLKIEYSDGNTIVNKQPGDIITVMLDYSRSEAITLEYNDDAFTLSGCSKSFTITSDKTCIFKVGDKPGQYTIGLQNGPKGAVRIMNEPKLIIVTDRQKLIERFNDENEVDALLIQAYKTAEKEGVVYDLNDYLDNTIWTSTSQYDGGQYAVK
jgi:hypothetical protein